TGRTRCVRKIPLTARAKEDTRKSKWVYIEPQALSFRVPKKSVAEASLFRHPASTFRACQYLGLTIVISLVCRPATPLTFGRDIAPITYKHCAPCHRPGEAAPFSLLSYDDVKAHARAIKAAVASRRMPPWLPDPAYGHYIEERRLSDGQIRQVLDW